MNILSRQTFFSYDVVRANIFFKLRLSADNFLRCPANGLGCLLTYDCV